MFISRLNLGRITNSNQIKTSLRHNPYRHIQMGRENIRIKKGSLKNESGPKDFYVMVEIEYKAGHVMSFERVTIEKGICTIRHLAVHNGFRGHGLGEPCTMALIKLLKNEQPINKVIFLESEGQNPLYQEFFNNNLKATLRPEKLDEWELNV